MDEDDIESNPRARAMGRRTSMDTRFGKDLDDDQIDQVAGAEGAALDAAMRRYKTFHAKEPLRVAELSHSLPDDWVAVGDALAVMYRTDKWKKDGVDEDYKHLHDKTDGQPYAEMKGVRMYEPAREVSRSKVQGRRKVHENPRPFRFDTEVEVPGSDLVEAYGKLRSGLDPAFGRRWKTTGGRTPKGATFDARDVKDAQMKERWGLAANPRGLPVMPRALTLLGYCLGAFVRRDDDSEIYEINPRGCYLFCSPSGDMLAIYSPDKQSDGSSGFLAAFAGGNLRVLKDGIDG